MKIIYLNGEKKNICEPVCSAVGFFDGLHVGHMALVHKVKEVAKHKNYKTALMTFDHHPLYILGKINEEKYMTSMEDRIHILEKENIDYLFVIEFTKEVAHLSPEDFIERYLLSLNICHVVCGFDFRFGDKNKGDVHTLQQHSQLDVSVVEEVVYLGEKISSTRIRKILENGKLDEMNRLLGRHYCITGKVIKGRHIGHSNGFPTANIDYASYFLPQRGVYVVKFYLNEKCYMGMCNIGYNPTYKVLDKLSLEVNILDFNDNIYNQTVTVEFYEMIRPEKSFASQDELIQQLIKDKDYVRKFFEEKMFSD